MTASRSRAALAGLALVPVLMLLGMVLAGAAPAPRTPPTCIPGSGPDLHGRRITAADLDRSRDLRCANLAGSDLSGVDGIQRDFAGALLRGADLHGINLTQADLTGADLTGAHAAGADLTQATLDSAVLRGADLSHAHLGQVEARQADFRDADLTGADLTQAHLDGAHLDHAQLDGTTMTQAYLNGASFTGARGTRPWDRYLLIACGVLYVLLVAGAVRTYVRRRPGYNLAQAIFGRMVLVVGVHLFVGYLLGRIVSTTGPPVDQTCSGVQCSLGVAAGGWAPFVGFVAIMLGGMISAAAGRRRGGAVPQPVPKLPPQLVQQLMQARMATPPPAPAAPQPVPPAAPAMTLPAPPPVTSPAPPVTVPASAPGVALTAEQSLLPPEVLQLALAGNKRAAARRYRELTGASRWEASSVLEGL